MTRRAISGFSTVLLTAVVLSAQALPEPQDPPTFRTGVDLVEVGVIVTDRQGKPVRDLTKEDFEIVEEGRAQTVHLLARRSADSAARACAATRQGGPGAGYRDECGA